MKEVFRMSEKIERANAYFNASFNCAQAVFAVFAEDYDIETETALRVAGGFGAGMRCGELCGAVTGGAMTVGAAKGHYIENDTGAKQNCAAATKAFADAFKAEFGCIICRELLGVDLTTTEGQTKFADEDMHDTKCKVYISKAVELLEEMGY